MGIRTKKPSSNGIVNTGKLKAVCPTGAPDFLYLLKAGEKFSTEALAESLSEWKSKRLAKGLVPFAIIEEGSVENKENTYYDGRREKILTDTGYEGSVYNILIDAEKYNALKSFEGSSYTQVIKGYLNGTFECVYNEDGSVSGIPLSGLQVSQRIEGTNSKPSNANVMLQYQPYELSTLIADFNLDQFGGIINITLREAVLSGSDITFKATDKSTLTDFASLDVANVKVTGADGSDKAVSGISYADGVYTLVGTGFAIGDVISGAPFDVAGTNDAYQVTTITVR